MAKEPEELSLNELVNTLEGPLSVVSCTRNPSESGRSERCASRKVWRGLADTTDAYLAEKCLRDLMDEAAEGEQGFTGPAKSAEQDPAQEPDDDEPFISVSS